MAASPKEKFEAAVKVIQTLPKNGLLKLAGSFQPSHDLMLKFYAYYKQATIGPCDIPRPAFWDVIGKAKWNAWNELGDMSKDEAMVNYVDSLKKIVEAMPHTDMVQGFVEKLGNFYELVDSADRAKAVGAGAVNGDAFPKIPIDSLRSVAKGVTKQMEEKRRAEEGHSSQTELFPDETEDREQDEEVTALLESMSANPPTPSHSDSTPMDSDSQGEEQGEEQSEEQPEEQSDSPRKMNGNGLYTHVPVNGKAQLNGNGFHSDEDDEEDEFCDTSDLPQELAEKIEETVMKRPFDPTYIPPSPHRVSPPPLLPPSRTASDVMLTRDQSSASLLLSPGQLSDRHMSSNSMQDDYRGSRGGVEILVARGGGGDQDGWQPPPPGGRRGSGGSGRGGGRGFPDRSGQSAPSGRSHLMSGSGGGGRRGGGGNGGGQDDRGEVNEQIALALVRLQQDMSSVLTRLHTLETLTLAQQQLQRSRQNSEGSGHQAAAAAQNPWWWPFPSLRGRTLFFVLVWPFIVHLILRMISNRRRIALALGMVASVALAKRHRQR